MISPFGYPFDDIYERIIVSLISDLGYEIERADQALQLGFVMCQRICKKIQQSEYIIADISEPNANVYYELGLSYGLNKKIILLLNKNSRNQYTDIFNNMKQKAVIAYDSLTDLADKEKFQDAMNDHICIDQDPSFQNNESVYKLNEYPTILNITNDVTIKDLHKIIIDEVITEKRKKDVKYMIQENINNQNPTKWEIDSVSVNSSFNLKNFNSKIKNSKICIIDTTHYEDMLNGYIYLCLGISHALERDVVPIVNSQLNKNIPFLLSANLWSRNCT